MHNAFVVFAEKMLVEPRLRTVFRRMVRRANISHRYSFLDPRRGSGQFSSHDALEFYRPGNFPNTARRMELFEQRAPVLMRKTVDRLALNEKERSGITHVLVTSCTGFYAPGLDFEIVDHLGLSAGVERTMVGFMGCYAAINALKLARHIVRSDPNAGCDGEPGAVHAALPGDAESGAGALVPGLCRWRGGESDYRVRAGHCSGQLYGAEGPRDKGTDRVEDPRLGFDMLLSGQVAAELTRALHDGELMAERDDIDLWAVHPGGRSVLDAVEKGLELRVDALAASREVLSCFGNMSSATVMFVLQRIMHQARPGQRGCAIRLARG